MNKIEALSDGETDYSLISKEYRALFGTTKYKCTIVFIGTEKEHKWPRLVDHFLVL